MFFRFPSLLFSYYKPSHRGWRGRATCTQNLKVYMQNYTKDRLPSLKTLRQESRTAPYLCFIESIDCTKRQQYTLVFLVAMINLFKQCSHSIHQPGISPPYFEFKLVCTIELSGEKEAIWKSNSPGFKFQE